MVHSCFEWSQDYGKKLKVRLRYNAVIILLTKSYSILAVCCLINLRHLSWTSPGEIIQSLATLFFLCLIIGFPILLSVIMIKNFKIIAKKKDEELRLKVGAFYEDLSTRKGKLVLMQPMWFLARRLILAMIVVNLD